MVGVVQEARLGSPTARARLRPAGGSFWHGLIAGRAHLGWRRRPGKPEGRWILRRYINGKYRVLGLGSADDARSADGDQVLTFEQAKAAALAALNAPRAQNDRLTVRQAFARYTEFKRSQGASTSDVEYRAPAHILPVLGDCVVAELDSQQLRNWLATLAASPAMLRSAKGARAKYRTAPADDEDVRRRRASANRVLTMLKAALNHAFDEGLVQSNDAWGRRLKPFRDVEVARVRYLTVAEAKRLINSCNPDFRKLVTAALQTGARYSELSRLEAADFNATAGTIMIRRSKSAKSRAVVLTEEGNAFFQQVTAGRSGDDLLFTRDGKPWRAAHQARPMRAACQRARISPPVGFHQLRHTWASLAVMAGVPLLVVAKNLGHVDTRMVEKHYGHLAPSFIADAIRAGAPRFGLKQKRTVIRFERS